MRAPASRNSGFTLVELIVASTLIVLVLSGVYLTFATAVRSWRGAESNYTTYEDARRALGLLERELQNIPPDAIHLTLGTETALEFVTLAQPLDVETAPSERLLRVRYRFVGNRSGGKLVREEALVTGPLPEAPVPPSRDLLASVKTGRSHEFEIARDVASLKLEYAWAGPAPGALPGMIPPPAPMLIDDKARYVLPEVITVTLVIDDPGNLSNQQHSEFRTRVTFRGPTNTAPEELLKRKGF